MRQSRTVWRSEARDNIFEANISTSQYYLAQVAEGKILPKEGPFELTEDTALFADGTSERIDAAVFATGYELSLPFLAQEFSKASRPTALTLTCIATPSIPTYRTWPLWASMFKLVPTSLCSSFRHDGSLWFGMESSRCPLVRR
jgi:Flavin-binding monooxygenase-like